MGFRFLFFLFLCGSAFAPHATDAPGFADALAESRKLQLAPGLKLDVWAAEPQLSNSVAFSLDGRGRVFLAESDRWAISVFDITTHTNWLLQDLSFRSVADRAAFLSNQFATNITFLTKNSEVIRRIEDRDGDGRADSSVIVADGFNSVVDGTAAGVLATGSSLYFASIPNLWRWSRPISESVSQPVSQNPESGSLAHSPTGSPSRLASGFGVHIGVSGHDLHGLIKGPDGRIYLSFGDRGCVLTNREGEVIHLPDTGGVLRCEPDGAHLEIFCYGLRNPQELAFDDDGNLWTVDNDTAGADPCRVLHLVEGGDYGWRCSYQHMEGFGPWVQEELWKGGKDGILPPAGTVSQGPSGLAFYPGTGFGDRLKGKFLHCDFPGGVWAFSVKPKGASFEVDTKEKFLWNCWPTDVDFGPDGAAYVLDWVSGWGQTPRGRIYRVTPAELDPAGTRANSTNSAAKTDGPRSDKRGYEVVAEVTRLLGEGMTQRGDKELLELLGHANRRVRLEAEWELFTRYQAPSPTGLVGEIKAALAQPSSLPARLYRIAAQSKNPQAAVHALRVLEQLIRTQGADFMPVLDRFADNNAAVRAAAIRVAGAVGVVNALPTLLTLSTSAPPALRFEAVMALSRLASSGNSRFFKDQSLFASNWFALHRTRTAAGLGPPPLPRPTSANAFDVLSANTADDPFIEHAAIRILTALDDTNSLAAATLAPDFRIRRGALLALRRLTCSAVTNFLADPDPRLIEEAGRAIHDVPIVEGLPALASFITKIDCPTNLYSRVIDACFRLGTQQHAQMLASFAVREDVPDAARVLAVRALADWERPAPLDRVNGLWRPLVKAERGMQSAESGTVAPVKSNPLLERAAQAARNLGRAAELPVLPPDLGRSVSFEEGRAVRRNPAPARRAFLRVAGDLLNPFNLTESGVPAGTREVLALQIAAVEAAAQLHVKEASTPLFEKFANTRTAADLRRAILPVLATLNAAQLSDAVRLALADPDPRVQSAALPLLSRLEGGDAVGLLAGLVTAEVNRRPDPVANRLPDDRPTSGPKKDGPSPDGRGDGPGRAQSALAALAKIPGPEADRVIQDALETLLAGTLPPALQLDVLAAARERATNSPALAVRLARTVSAQPADDPLARWRFALEGGDALRGKVIFFQNPSVQCLRCHKMGNDGGTVGPGLSDIGKRYPREYLLESIVRPNARMGAGFENVVVTMKDGATHVGLVKRETDNSLVLETTEAETGETRTVPLRKSQIERRERGPSAMPEGLAEMLTPFELRDLMEYLARAE